MRTQARIIALRRKLRAIMGEGKYRIRSDATVWVYADGWQLVGRWPDLEEIIPRLPEDENGKKWLTGDCRVIYY